MATSGQYSFSISRDDLIRDAMFNIGKIGENDGPTPSEVQDVSRRLNMLVSQFRGTADFAPGIKEWTRRTGFLFLSNTTGQYQVGPNAPAHWTNSYISTALSFPASSGDGSVVVDSAVGMTIGDNIAILVNSDLFWTTISGIAVDIISLTDDLPGDASENANVFTYTKNAQFPIVIETVNLRDTNANNTDTLIPVLSRSQYDQLPSKVDLTNVSDPVAVMVEHQLGNAVLYTDCAKSLDVSKVLVVEYLGPTQVFVDPLDEPDYPMEWYLFLTWALAKQCAPMFSVMWEPIMEENYKEAALVARNLYTDDTPFGFQSGVR